MKKAEIIEIDSGFILILDVDGSREPITCRSFGHAVSILESRFGWTYEEVRT